MFLMLIITNYFEHQLNDMIIVPHLEIIKVVLLN